MIHIKMGHSLKEDLNIVERKVQALLSTQASPVSDIEWTLDTRIRGIYLSSALISQ